MSSAIRIVEDPVSNPAVIALLDEHLADMRRNSPPGCVFALEPAALRAPGITFWTAWRGDDLLGCAALRELDAANGEIKAMRTASKHLGTGVATTLLRHAIAVAGERGYEALWLETGSGPAFSPAHALYERHGFRYCGPFASYEDGEFSRFMRRRLP